MCEFQVSKIFDVNSSLEKRLDTMAVSYDFVLPHDLQHQQRQKLFLVSVVYHIFGAYFSVALVCSRFCWLQSGMEQKFPISCLMQLLGNLPFLFFFVPNRYAIRLLKLKNTINLIRTRSLSRTKGRCDHKFLSFEIR